MSELSCSVVVCTYNRLTQLQRCLPSLLAQRHVPGEVIVVDDGSTDGTAAWLATVKDSRLRVVAHDENRGLACARNTGVAAARYPMVAFTDDDCVADPGWLGQLAAAFTDGSVGLAMGEVVYVQHGYRGYFPERIVDNRGARWPKGCNVAYRREVFARLGGFRDEFYAYQNEDSEMAIRAVAAGYGFRRVPGAVVCHQPAQWTVRTLLATARNPAVWPILKRRYPRHYRVFGPPVRFGVVVNPEDYAYVILLPVLLPLLLVRYLLHGKRDLAIFFAKWPLLLLLRRFHVWRTAIAYRSFML